jgi:hypothetical protein
VDRYLINYGGWDAEKIAVAKTYRLVIVHPSNSNLTRAQIADLQRGIDPDDPADDVLVLGYLSAGEDLRTVGVSDAEMLADPRFTGDGTGPRIDPRGPDADGGALEGIPVLGSPSTGGTRYASWYLDDNSVDRNGVGDGKPDRNAAFGGCFVNAGDPRWFDVVDAMTIDGPDGVAGLREILMLSTGRGLGCDGVFLDTFDTCAPNAYTDPSSPNPSEFEWTAPGFRDFTRRLRAAYPGKLILQNRGLFLFDPRLPHYRVTTRGSVDLVLFESYRLDSSSGSDNPHPLYYPDNRFNLAPKLVAEAQRPDGFQVLSLGYAEGPSNAMSELTLVGQSTLGYDSLVEDIRVTQEEAGFRHYLTDAAITLVNSFVRDHGDLTDREPPVWTSTWNDRAAWPAVAPTPRAGLQEVVPGPGRLTVRWDVALDLHRVGYALYLKTSPFDFAADPALATATRIVLEPSMGAGYADGPGPAVYPFEATVRGLAPGTTYYLLLRAFDHSPSRHEETNTRVLQARPAAP